MKNRIFRLSCLVNYFLIGAVAISAADPATTDIRNVDSNYQWVGEYDSIGRTAKTGLQVAVRNGEKPLFAKLYRGGLPGIGWDNSPPREFAGVAEKADFVLLQAVDGSTGTVRLTNGSAALSDPSGAETVFRKVARRSVTLGLKPPAGAKILFDGTSTAAWKHAKLTEEGFLKAGTETVDPIGGCRLHVEFRTPYMPASEGQRRGNSGVYIQRRYEVQILDSFALEGVENECGALYRQRRPDVNMALPPLVWQTYDIFFVPARFDSAGIKSHPAEISVIHNGVPAHFRTAIAGKTGAGKPEAPQPMPMWLQDHGDPVVFRNIWLQPLERLPPLIQTASARCLFPEANIQSTLFARMRT